MSDNQNQPPTAYDIGFAGTPETIAALVIRNKPDVYHVQRGVIDAFLQEHRAENAQAYLKTFMSEKVKDIWYGSDRVSSGQNYYMGQDCQNAMTATVIKLVEHDPSPAETMLLLLAPMNDHERGVALHMITTSATWHNQLRTLEAALALQGPTGKSGEYAVYVAADKGHTEALDLLHKNGACFDVLKDYARFSFGPTNYVEKYATPAPTQQTPSVTTAKLDAPVN